LSLIDARRNVLGATLLALCGACATVPTVQQGFTGGRDGIEVGAPATEGQRSRTPAALPLPGPDLRVLSWNLHEK
jgi:hypothetical protein